MLYVKFQFMSSIITNNFRTDIAKSFIDMVNNNNVYLFISRSQKWKTEENLNNPAVSESSAPIPTDNYEEFNRIFDSMIAIKKINNDNLAKTIRKIIWRSGEIYDMYKHNYSITNPASSGATTLADSNFYVVNSQFQVFKCIYNGQSPETPLGKVTTIGSEPTVTGSPITIITTADGYKWKFLYTIDTNQALNFANNNYIPVYINNIVSSAAIPGSINQINILNRGSNFTPGIYYTKIIGNGNGAIARIVVPNETNNPLNLKISEVSLVSTGSNYTHAQINLAVVFSDIGCTVPTNIGTVLPNNRYYLEPIVSPAIGHGADPEKELEAYRVAIAPKLSSNDNNIPVNISYRQYGLLINPIINNTNSQLFTNITGSAAYKIKFPNSFTGNFNNEEKISQTNTNAKGVVIAWDNVNKILTYYQNEYTDNGTVIKFSGQNLITNLGGVNSLPEDTFNSVVENINFVNGYAQPQIEKYTGKIWYIESRSSTINRSLDQEEKILLILEF